MYALWSEGEKPEYSMNKEIIKYSAVALASLFTLASCHWHSHDNGVRYVERPGHPLVVHHVDQKPKHHKAKKKHYKEPKHVKRHYPVQKKRHNSKPVPPPGPYRR